MMRVLRVFAIVFGSLLLIACTPTPINAQVHHGFDDSVRADLIEAQKDSLERGYCVTLYYSWDAASGEKVYDVWRIERAAETARTKVSLMFDCANPDSPTIHTHPSGDCNPSRVDYTSLLLSEHPFGIVVCRGGASRFYWPHEARAQLGPNWVRIVEGWKARRDSIVRDSARQAMPRPVFYGALASATAISWRGLDRDPGGYPDRWYTEDKLTHFSVGYGLTSAAITAGIPPAEAAVSICAVAIVYEFVMGWVSRKDIAMGCGGAGLAWAWDRVWR